jgi:hypothetical protein
MQHNPKQRWHYVTEMRADEVLLLKCYDRARDGRAVLSARRVRGPDRTRRRAAAGKHQVAHYRIPRDMTKPDRAAATWIA